MDLIETGWNVAVIALSPGKKCPVPMEWGWVSLRAGLHVLEKTPYLVTFMTKTPDHPASIPVTISLSFRSLCLNYLLFNLYLYLSYRTQVRNLKIHNSMKIKVLTVYIPNSLETHTIVSINLCWNCGKYLPAIPCAISVNLLNDKSYNYW